MPDDGPVIEPERQQLLEALHRHLDAGRLDLDQFDVRVARLYAADTRAAARLALVGLPLLEAVAAPSRRSKGRRGEGEAVQSHWVGTDEVFRDPTSGRVMRVWVDPTDGARHYAETGP